MDDGDARSTFMFWCLFEFRSIDVEGIHVASHRRYVSDEEVKFVACSAIFEYFVEPENIHDEVSIKWCEISDSEIEISSFSYVVEYFFPANIGVLEVGSTVAFKCENLIPFKNPISLTILTQK